ncbi:MAG: hypothetical protein WC682_01690 [Parcubacteria group bacterium]|jgi:type II secretory pathway pseudopilin PulG
MFKMKNKKDYFLSSRSGMSLLELIIMIAIIGIMSAISISAMAASKINSELETAAEEVMAVLREAQNYSLTGKNITPTCNVYTVAPVAGTSNYTLKNGAACALNFNYSLKNNVIFSVGGAINFSAPHAASSGTTRFVLSKSAKFYTVCVNSVGLVRKLNGNVACP